jgi:hypothetical protein
VKIEMPSGLFRVIWVIVLIIHESRMGSQDLRNGLKTALKDWLYSTYGGATKDYITSTESLGLNEENW